MKGFILIIFVFVSTSLLLQTACATETGASIPVKLHRRQKSDIYTILNSSSGEHCGSINTTYLVSQKECVKNEELFRGRLYISYLHTNCA